MNFVQMPFQSDAWYWGVTLSIIVIPILMLVYFKRKGWF